MKKKINLIFHNIVEREGEIKNRYDFVYKKALSLISKIKSIIEKENVELIIFLDDGYKSQYKFAIEVFEKLKLKVFVALISEKIGMDGYLTLQDCLSLENLGIKLCSHGVSHAALGKYENGVLLKTQKGGCYRNSAIGHAKSLSEKEVAFQVIESAKELKKMGFKIDYFVYPYGIYNEFIKDIVSKSSLYKKAHTCDEKLEDNEAFLFAIPRFLVCNDNPKDELFLKIKDLFNK